MYCIVSTVKLMEFLLSGERLKLLGEPYTIILHSTMPRASETAHLIAESLPGVPMKSCDLLREGAPCPPDPPSPHWKPDDYVSHHLIYPLWLGKLPYVADGHLHI